MQGKVPLYYIFFGHNYQFFLKDIFLLLSAIIKVSNILKANHIYRINFTNLIS